VRHEFEMQITAQLQFSPRLQKPNCAIWYAGDPCDQSIQQYNELIEQGQRKEWQSSVVVPLQQQITDQQKLIADQQAQITMLQTTIDSQTRAAVQNEVRNRASLDFLGAILGIGFAFLVALATFRKLAGNWNSRNREKGRAAAA
jgi:hypothetical protein